MNNTIKAIYELTIPKWVKRIFISNYEETDNKLETLQSEITELKSKVSSLESHVTALESQ